MLLLCKKNKNSMNMMLFHNVLLKEQKNKKSQLRNIVHLVWSSYMSTHPTTTKVIENPNDHLHGKPQKEPIIFVQ